MREISEWKKLRWKAECMLHIKQLIYLYEVIMRRFIIDFLFTKKKLFNYATLQYLLIHVHINMRDQKKIFSFATSLLTKLRQRNYFSFPVPHSIYERSLKMERKFTKEIMCDVGCGNMRLIWQYVKERRNCGTAKKDKEGEKMAFVSHDIKMRS